MPYVSPWRAQGLGKTVQTVAFLSHLRQNGINGPFLIVVPLSTIVNWQKEVARWCPSMRAIIFHGTKADRQAIEKEWFRPEYSRAPPPCDVPASSLAALTRSSAGLVSPRGVRLPC